MFEQIRSAGGEATFWLAPQPDYELLDPAALSNSALFTPLHAAIQSNNVKMVEHLLSHGFNPNIQPAQVEVVRYILQSKIQVLDATDVHGNTAIHYLAGQRFHNEDLISILRSLPEFPRAWREIKNRFGHAAGKLYLDSKAVDEDGPEPVFWKEREHDAWKRGNQKSKLWKVKLHEAFPEAHPEYIEDFSGLEALR